MVAIMHTQRIDSHLVPEDGSVAVKEPGICKFCLSSQVFYYFKGCRDHDHMVSWMYNYPHNQYLSPLTL